MNGRSEGHKRICVGEIGGFHISMRAVRTISIFKTYNLVTTNNNRNDLKGYHMADWSCVWEASGQCLALRKHR